MSMVSLFFSRIGLTKNEQDIYLFLLEAGPTIASLIGKRLGIKRVTVYPSLEALKRKELVTTFEKNEVTYFAASSPKEVLQLCKKRVDDERVLEKEAKDMLPFLELIQNKQKKPVFEVKGKIKYYQGLEPVKQLINETLEEGQVEQLCFGLNKYHIQHLQDDWKQYTKRRVHVGMPVRSIQPDIPEAKAYKKRDKSELRQTHLVPHKKYPADCELNIIGDMIALFSTHGDQPTGLKMYNADMARILRSLFELAWEAAEKHDPEKA